MERNEMKPYKAIIFDLDGVICHTDHYHYLAWKRLADELGIQFDEQMNHLLRGVSRLESLEIILQHSQKEVSSEVKNHLLTKKNEMYVELLQQLNPAALSQDVLDTLHALRDKGIRLAIGSSSRNAKYILAQLDITHLFEVVSSGENITKSKPDPEVFQYAADHLGLISQECLVVEDAQAGIDAAFYGGFDSAGIGDIKSYERVTYSLEKFDDLLKYV